MNKQKEEFDEDIQNIDTGKTHKTLASIQLKKVPPPQSILHAKILNNESGQSLNATANENQRREQGDCNRFATIDEYYFVIRLV